MELRTDLLVSPDVEVPVLDGDVVTAIRTLAGRGIGKRIIAREVGVSINTVRRYLRRVDRLAAYVKKLPKETIVAPLNKARKARG